MTTRTFENYTGLVNVKDYGAVGDGVTDDTAAFMAMSAAFAGMSVEILIPPGTYILQRIAAGSRYFGGMSKVKVSGYGATLQEVAAGDLTYGFFTGAEHFYHGQPELHAKIQSVSSRDAVTILFGPIEQTYTVTLVTEAHNARFTEGQWVMIGSCSLQAGGYPANNYYNEFHKIADITGAVVTLEDPIRYQHLSTMPNYTPLYDNEEGGSATMYCLVEEWDTEIEYCGLRLHFPSHEDFYTSGRSVKYTDCFFDQCGPVPSGNQFMILERCTIDKPTRVEVDKMVEHLILRDCKSTNWLTQSPSINHYVFENCIIDGIHGTARNTIIRNTECGTLNFGNFGGYGNSAQVLIENSRITDVSGYDGASYTAPLTDFTFSNGTLTHDLATGGPSGLEVPGTRVVWRGWGSYGNWEWYPPEFIVLDVRQDGSDVHIDTTLPASFDFATHIGDGTSAPTGLVMLPHTCPNVTVINSTGCAQIVDLSQTPANRPLHTYARRVLMGNAALTDVMRVKGYLTEIKFDVLKAYTGIETDLVLNFAVAYCDSTDPAPATTYAVWEADIDMELTGVRTIVPGSVTGNVGNDVIPTLAVGTWIVLWGKEGWYSDDISAEAPSTWPIVEITMQTDQGLVALNNIEIHGSNLYASQ